MDVTRFACLALGLSTLAACSNGTSPTDAGGTDTAIDMMIPTDTPEMSDGSPTDAPVGSFSGMTLVTSFAQRCADAGTTDPLSFTGTVSVTNTGTTPLGPIMITRGEVVDLGGTNVTTAFDLTPVTINLLAPGATGMASVTKVAGSAMPIHGCSTVMCSGSPYRMRVLLSGAGLPTGAGAPSEPVTPMCTM